MRKVISLGLIVVASFACKKDEENCRKTPDLKCEEAAAEVNELVAEPEFTSVTNCFAMVSPNIYELTYVEFSNGITSVSCAITLSGTRSANSKTLLPGEARQCVARYEIAGGGFVNQFRFVFPDESTRLLEYVTSGGTSNAFFFTNTQCVTNVSGN